jgi:Domain of unknown function (DUF4372)/Transposase DDE domain
MNEGRTVFAQLLDYLPKHEFDKCVQRYHGHHHNRGFSCWDQLLCMAFAQFTSRESLRDLETCLRTKGSKLYHSGFRGKISRSTLADANERRDYRIYEDFAHILIGTARRLYAKEDFRLHLDQTTYALDSTTVDLCLSLFPWATFRKHKAAVKLHTLLDLQGNIPTTVIVTHGKVHDVKILDELPLQAGAIYIMDRGYLDYSRLFRLHQAGAFFVTRSKRSMDCRRVYSHPYENETGIQCDQTIALCGVKSRRDYPDRLRRVRYFDAERNKRLVFLTNNFTLPALTIAELYRCRWQVELFFKWIKQHLRIKAFFGTSENAVKTQIWIAIATYVLISIVKKQLGAEASLYTILQILSISLFDKTPILRAFAADDYENQDYQICNQLDLFNY